MTVTIQRYAECNQGLGTKQIDFVNDTFKAVLVDNTYTFSDSHGTANISGEVSGTGYTAGGNTLANTGFSQVSGKQYKFTADDTTWSGSSITARGCVIQDTTAGKNIVFIDFGEDQTSASGDFTIDFDATNGILDIN